MPSHVDSTNPNTLKNNDSYAPTALNNDAGLHCHPQLNMSNSCQLKTNGIPCDSARCHRIETGHCNIVLPVIHQPSAVQLLECGDTRLELPKSPCLPVYNRHDVRFIFSRR